MKSKHKSKRSKRSWGASNHRSERQCSCGGTVTSIGWHEEYCDSCGYELLDPDWHPDMRFLAYPNSGIQKLPIDLRHMLC